MSDRIELEEEQYKRPEDRGDPYDIKKDGKDPWKQHPVAAAASWGFWLAMLYFATAGLIYGALTGKEAKQTALSEAVFAPAEFLRGWSMTYRGITDWQIGFFREKEADKPGPGY